MDVPPFLGVNHFKILGVIFLVDIPLVILLSFSYFLYNINLVLTRNVFFLTTVVWVMKEKQIQSPLA